MGLWDLVGVSCEYHVKVSADFFSGQGNPFGRVSSLKRLTEISLLNFVPFALLTIKKGGRTIFCFAIAGTTLCSNRPFKTLLKWCNTRCQSNQKMYFFFFKLLAEKKQGKSVNISPSTSAEEINHIRSGL